MRNEGAKSPFLNRVREVIRTRHYSIRTEQSYVHWVKRFILFHGKRHPNELGETKDAVRAKRPERLPVIRTKAEVRQLFAHLDGANWLPARLL